MGTTVTFRALMVFAVLSVTYGVPEVHWLTPTVGSLMGCTRITIYGQGFAADQFSMFDKTKGNKVMLLNTVSTLAKPLECRIHVDGSTTTQIMCDLPSRMHANVYYTVRVSVNGKDISESDHCKEKKERCMIRAMSYFTPTISKLTPHSGIPGAIFLAIEGRIITDRYGNNEIAGTNGRKEHIYPPTAPLKCELKSEDEFYRLKLKSNASLYGDLVCLPTGTFIGNANFSYQVDGSFGCAKPSLWLMWPGSDGGLYMIQYYTNVESLSPTVCGTQGGLLMTVNGKFYEDAGPSSTYVKAVVLVGGQLCVIVSIETNGPIICKVPPKPNATEWYSGGRGVLIEYFEPSSVSDLALVMNQTNPAGTIHLDESKFCGSTNISTSSTLAGKPTRMTFLFVPHKSGEYAFLIKADDGGMMRVNVYQGATLQSTGWWVRGQRVTLVANKMYAIVAVANGLTDADHCVTVRVDFYDTVYTRKQTYFAVSEKQLLKISSGVTNEEVVELSFGGLSKRTVKHAVQKLCRTITSDPDLVFRIGLYRVYSDSAKFSDPAKVNLVLNAIASKTDNESFTVVSEGLCLKITFKSNRGGIPLLTTTHPDTLTVEEVTQGISDGNHLVLMYEGIPGPPMEYGDPNEFAQVIEKSLYEMFGVKCPSKLSQGEGFEDTGSKEKSFCGRRSMKNPKRLFPLSDKVTSQSLATKNWLCFAVLGLEENELYINYKSPSNIEFKHSKFIFEAMATGDKDGWKYTCIDLLKLVQSENLSERSTAYTLRFAWVENKDKTKPFYVDSIAIVSDKAISSPDDLKNSRLGENIRVRIDNVKVTVLTYDKVKYKVILVPLDCVYNLKNLTLANSIERDGVSTVNNSQVTMTTNKTKSAPGPPKGVFKASYGIIGHNTTDNIDVEMTDDEIKSILEKLHDIGTLNIVRTKESTCANIDINIEFVTRGGNRPPLEVYTKDLTNPKIVDVVFQPKQDGFLTLNPIQGTHTRLLFKNPQVEVIINNIVSTCAGDCSFNWSTAITPNMTSLTPVTGSAGSNLTITGSGLTTTKGSVVIANSTCVVLDWTDTAITCTLGEGPLGQHKVFVFVPGRGYAAAAASLHFTFSAGVGSISPADGSYGGGTTLTVKGLGFSNGNTIVKVNGTICEILSITLTEIRCTVPAAVAVSNPPLDEMKVTVVVCVFDQELTNKPNFTYKDSLTVYASLSHDGPLTVQGQQNITLDGTNVHTVAQVFIGTTEILSFTKTSNRLTFVTPAAKIQPGKNLHLKLVTPHGYVLGSNRKVIKVTILLEVTQMTPEQGSLYGGTVLTIKGGHFGTDPSKVKVKVGEKMCIVSSVSDTEIICQIEPTAKFHKINSEGLDGYFAFSNDMLCIVRGDTVVWTWTKSLYTPSYHSIIQTNSSKETTLKDGGFSSGQPTQSGFFQRRFTKTENISVLGSVNNGTFTYGMSVIVKPQLSVLEELSVWVHGYIATHDKSKRRKRESGGTACIGATANIDGCTPDNLSPPRADVYYFFFSKCSSPVVNEVSSKKATQTEKSGTSSTEITVKGKGFSANNCANHGFLGDCTMTGIASDSSNTSFKFMPGEECDYKSGVLLQVGVHVDHYGYALIDIEDKLSYSIAIVPHVKTIDPKTGSPNGGANVILTGSALNGSVVKFGDAIASCVSTYSQIECISPKLNITGSVNVSVSNGHFIGVCECNFTYNNSITPEVTSANPTSVSLNSLKQISFSGTKLGNVETVSIGDEQCIDIKKSNNWVNCTVTAIPAGSNEVIVRDLSVGYANIAPGIKINVSLEVSTITPNKGSIHGGTNVTILGFGFAKPISLTFCAYFEIINLTQIKCVTKDNNAEMVAFDVESNGQTASVNFEYEEASTPSISSVVVSNGVAIITGTGYSNKADVTVAVDDTKQCNVTEASATEIKCNLGATTSGKHNISVLVAKKGKSNSKDFTSVITATTVTPSAGDTRGSQFLTITGNGFYSYLKVTVCGNDCRVETLTQTEIVCQTPPHSATDVDCDVKVVDEKGNTIVATGKYAYVTGTAPTISEISPTRGGTAGGTSLTITGVQFSGAVSASVSAPTVSIAGSTCSVTFHNATVIVCETGAHAGSIQAKLDVLDNGIVALVATGVHVSFHYVDLWSSVLTWGGVSIPTKDEFVVIPSGQAVLLDVSTPVLAMLLIRGGSVIFAGTTPDSSITLNAKIILIMDGGRLQAGTEEKPYPAFAIIELHGHRKDPGLPIYGSKVLALRDGVLDLHGKPIRKTWTLLATKADAGAKNIIVQGQMKDWSNGCPIVIASTGNKNSGMMQNEKRTIIAAEYNDVTDTTNLTLNETLIYKHLGDDETFGNVTVQMRAEVALLCRNVIVRGNDNPEWHDKIEACKEGFDAGEFATQTCFQGRFGEEKGSSQYGGHILIHSSNRTICTTCSKARLSNIEVTHAGQAFKLGRYPIHFHLNEDMDGSYVKECVIHYSFNRAINIHATYNLVIENNVFYNIMGGAMFLEDGIETGNVIQYNLAVFVKASTSLLNDDITPAAFWVTNPNNTIQHNHAAGGTHFGYWYRMHEHPDGPSYTPNICPKHVPLGIFYNNTAHSLGWFGLWIFQDYFPQKGGSCKMGYPETAVFQLLICWNNGKCAEAVNFAHLHFVMIFDVQSWTASFEAKRAFTGGRFGPDRPLLCNSVIVGIANKIDNQNIDEKTKDAHVTEKGVVLPFGNFVMKNVTFVNFIKNSVAIGFTSIDGTCTDQCGGFFYWFYNLNFNNTIDRVLFRWPFEGVIHDMDGTLSGKKNVTIQPQNSVLPATCTTSTNFTKTSGLNAKICSNSETFHRLAFNKISPESLTYNNLRLKRNNSVMQSPNKLKRLTHKQGWMVVLVDGEVYAFSFDDDGKTHTNMSFIGTLSDMQNCSCVIIDFSIAEMPDVVDVDDKIETGIMQNATFTCKNKGTLKSGDWFYDTTSRKLRIMFKGPKSNTAVDLDIKLKIYKCFYPECKPPKDPETSDPAETRPRLYSLMNENIWVIVNKTITTTNSSSEGKAIEHFMNPGSRRRRSSTATKPDVTIPAGQGKHNWVVVKTVTDIKVRRLLVQGGLEFDYSQRTKKFSLEVDFLIIQGGRFVAGWPNNPMLGALSIKLTGKKGNPMYSPHVGAPVGTNAIGVFGGLDLNGPDINSTWTRLANTAAKGSKTINLEEDVSSSWKSGDWIIVTSTSYNPKEAEKMEIDSINSKTVTLKSALKYRHQAAVANFKGKTVKMGAAVGLLTRSIVVEGQTQAGGSLYGGRVLVSVTTITDAKGNMVTRTGFARVTNVEFRNMGQEGWNSPTDPRYALACVSVGAWRTAKPSLIKGNSFHDLHNTAVGVFGCGNLTIADNVVFEPVGPALVTTSDATTLTHNLFANLKWDGGINGRKEYNNKRYDALVESMEASNTKLLNNYVAGSERVGFHVRGYDCKTLDKDDDYTNNYAFGSLMGVVVFPADDIKVKCLKISGFHIQKNRDYGLYYHNEPDGLISDVTFTDNYVSLFTLVIGPSAVSLTCENKTIVVRNCVIIGTFPGTDCIDETSPSGTYFDLSEANRGLMGAHKLRLGILIAQFTQGSNKCPDKPCGHIMAYNTICGNMTMIGNTFANFGPHASCGASVGLATSPENDDLHHPVTMKLTQRQDVVSSHIVYYHRPNVGKVNPSDCVDMDCDAMKKALIKDEDGSYIGYKGAIVPEAEYEWGGDPRHGVGDYRIPKSMLTDSNGKRILPNQLATKRGIVRTNNCELKQYFNIPYYYQCRNEEYGMLVIESMDKDRETRRLSPVAVLSNDCLDLINGPQDHGWCAGYTCQKRISLFHALVLRDFQVTVYLSSTEPHKIRFFLLDVPHDFCTVVIFYYINPNRIDLYKEDTPNNLEFKYPQNAKSEAGTFTYKNDAKTNYIPTCAHEHGAYYVDTTAKLVYFTLKGSRMVQLHRASVIVISFRMAPISEANFFKTNVIRNLALLLNIVPSKIRLMKVVSGSTTDRRRKRSTESSTVTLEVGEPPKVNIDLSDTSSEPDTEPDTDKASKLNDQCQENTLSSTLGEDVVCEQLIIAESVYNPIVPSQLYFQEVATMQHEGVHFETQPKIRAIDSENTVIPTLGIAENPWQITASLRNGTGHAKAVLSGTLTVVFSDGWFNFTDLAISHAGSGYIIDYVISSPASANLSVESSPFTVPRVPLSAGIHLSDSDTLQSTVFSMTLDLRDSVTNTEIADISWRDHTFTITCGMVVELESGVLSGLLTQDFESSNGRAQFDALSYSGFGPIYLGCRVMSTPAEYDFYSYHEVIVLNSIQQSRLVEKTETVVLRFKADFETALPTDLAKAQFKQMVMDNLLQKSAFNTTIIRTCNLQEGSILVSFTLEGQTVDVTLALSTLCSDIKSGNTITVGSATLTMDGYMTVDGEDYYSTCTSPDSKTELHPGYIALIVVLAVLLVAALIFVLVWKFNIRPSAKTHGTRCFNVTRLELSETTPATTESTPRDRYAGGFYYIDNGRTVFLAGPNQKVEDIFDKRKVTTGLQVEVVPPVTTLYDDNTGSAAMRKSVTPEPFQSYRERTLTLTPLGN